MLITCLLAFSGCLGNNSDESLGEALMGKGYYDDDYIERFDFEAVNRTLGLPRYFCENKTYYSDYENRTKYNYVVNRLKPHISITMMNWNNDTTFEVTLYRYPTISEKTKVTSKKELLAFAKEVLELGGITLSLSDMRWYTHDFI